MLSLELALLSWDNTCLVCVLHSHPGFAHSICVIICCAIFGARTIILRLYSFSLRVTLSSRVCSFNLHDHSLCSLWSSRYYLEIIPIQFAHCTLIRDLLIQSTRSFVVLKYYYIYTLFFFLFLFFFFMWGDNVLCFLPLKVLREQWSLWTFINKRAFSLIALLLITLRIVQKQADYMHRHLVQA